MIKRVIALILVLLVTLGGCAYAVPNKVSPHEFQVTPTLNVPGIGEIFFAEDMIETFMGPDWQIFDAFYLKIDYRYAMISYTYDNGLYDYDWISIVMSPEKVYYMTPIIFDNTMIFDFTNVPPAEYKIYLVHNIINGND